MTTVGSARPKPAANGRARMAHAHQRAVGGAGEAGEALGPARAGIRGCAGPPG